MEWTCDIALLIQRHFDEDPLIQWLTETGFLIKMWQATLINFSLTLTLSKSNKRLNFKIWHVTFNWILGTHVDPYPYITTLLSYIQHKMLVNRMYYRDILTHWLCSSPIKINLYIWFIESLTLPGQWQITWHEINHSLGMTDTKGKLNGRSWDGVMVVEPGVIKVCYLWRTENQND